MNKYEDTTSGYIGWEQTETGINFYTVDGETHNWNEVDEIVSKLADLTSQLEASNAKMEQRLTELTERASARFGANEQ